MDCGMDYFLTGQDFIAGRCAASRYGSELLAQPDRHRRQVASALSSCAEAKKQFSTEARRAAAARRDAKFGLPLS